MIPDAKEDQPKSRTGTYCHQPHCQTEPRNLYLHSAFTKKAAVPRVTLVGTHLRGGSQRLLNGVLRIRDHLHFLPIHFREKAKPACSLVSAQRPGSIRPDDKSPTNWSAILRGCAAILSLEWIVDGKLHVCF